jgi:hypothetical protein
MSNPNPRATSQTASAAAGSLCPIYPGGIVLYGVGQQAFLYYARVCPAGPITTLLSYRPLNTGCTGGTNCASMPVFPAALGVMNDPQGLLNSPNTETSNIAFDAMSVFINKAIDGPVKPDSVVQNDPRSNGQGIVVDPPRNFKITGLNSASGTIVIRAFRLTVTPPPNSPIVDPRARPTPTHVISVGIEVEPGATNIQAVTFPTKVFTPFYCQVLDTNANPHEIFHVRTQTPIVIAR